MDIAFVPRRIAWWFVGVEQFTIRCQHQPQWVRQRVGNLLSGRAMVDGSGLAVYAGQIEGDHFSLRRQIWPAGSNASSAEEQPGNYFTRLGASYSGEEPLIDGEISPNGTHSCIRITIHRGIDPLVMLILAALAWAALVRRFVLAPAEAVFLALVVANCLVFVFVNRETHRLTRRFLCELFGVQPRADR